MEHRDGATAPNSKRAKVAFAGGDNEDRLSALPDDVLIDILLKLRDTAVAARTSILSGRWRRLWALLPEIHFSDGTDPDSIGPALADHEAPVLRLLFAVVRNASPNSMAAWLPIAAGRLSGDLIFRNKTRYQDVGRGTFELPCFENATSIRLDLGHLGLAMPAAGVFARLTDLCLAYMSIHGRRRLGEAISSPRCPALRKLAIRHSRGLGNLAINSESLLQMKLSNLDGVKKLTVVAPALEELTWKDNYGLSSFELGEMPRLQCLFIGNFLAFGSDKFVCNPNSLMLLQRFDAIHKLNFAACYKPSMVYNQYLVKGMPRLPHITFMYIELMAYTHSFGACLFNILRMCTGVTKLALDARSLSTSQEGCPSDCLCDQPSNWKSMEIVLDGLQEVEISSFIGTRHEVAFLERLFSWAMMLKQMTVTFDERITESMAIKQFCQKLLSFSRPEICLRFFVYRDDEKVFYVPEDEDI
ncbi:unnamed protein product [Alopecurus aequalis]